ncbi:MAG: manganese efflux pump MntP family protein [Lachnospiraceae bacterium]|nr:manganese efflux pump MntP family protein [Lachnospiraceae bacterium]MEE3461646.1 manganese efflux pump MntP family protein [Lachnospiraceae bacterium]
MSILEIFLMGVGLSMDAFAVSVCKGLAVGKIRLDHVLKAGLWFGVFQVLMPLIGYFFCGIFKDSIDRYDHWISFILLVLIGANMIKEAFGEEEDTSAKMDIKTMFLLAVATSIDALACGVTMAFSDVNIWGAVTIIGLTTFAFSCSGIKIGSLFGEKYKKGGQITGGIILISLGIKILVQGLM